MQLLVPTGQAVARRYGINRSVTSSSLFDPDLNITLGTGYMRDQFNEFGKLEYVAAAYNAGPGRPRQWRNTLPLQIDEWTEAIPFRETRGYVQGVIRNMLQYRRLYDENGQFRAEVGARPLRSQTAIAPQSTPQQTVAPNDGGVRPRRVGEPEMEDER
jgi:soluble lytic murein transglycosylase